MYSVRTTSTTLTWIPLPQPEDAHRPAESFLGALQATVSIVLVIFYGVVATQFKLLDGHASKKISTICINLFLPALLVTKVGSQLHASTAARYIPVLSTWAIFYALVSIAVGLLASRSSDFPCVTPALAFNNTTSLPLLLIDSLESTGILNRLLLDDDSTKDAINRAQTYFLLCAIVGNSLTFALGPRLIDTGFSPDEEEEEPREVDEEEGDVDEDHSQQHRQERRDDVERVPPEPTDLTSLLLGRVRTVGDEIKERVSDIGRKHWMQLSPRTRDVLVFLSEFVNPPLIGAVAGAIIGLSPPLHRAFFNDSRHGGYFNAWLTISPEKAGELFATLQVVVVGVSLSSALRKMKRGEDNGLPWLPVAFIFLVRFVLWPISSIAIIWGLAAKMKILPQDPILCFAMMLMPTGTPAMKLVAMGKVNDIGSDQEMILSKLLTVSYHIAHFGVNSGRKSLCK